MALCLSIATEAVRFGHIMASKIIEITSNVSFTSASDFHVSIGVVGRQKSYRALDLLCDLRDLVVRRFLPFLLYGWRGLKESERYVPLAVLA